MPSVQLDRSPGAASRTAAVSGLAFTVPYLLHRLLQGTGPDGATTAAVGISGGVFLAMGFVSNAAETALIGVADSNQPAAVLALDQLRGASSRPAGAWDATGCCCLCTAAWPPTSPCPSAPWTSTRALRYEALRYYHQHPRARDELTTQDGLARLQFGHVRLESL